VLALAAKTLGNDSADGFATPVDRFFAPYAVTPRG
jgi:hypothetical protein